MRQFELSPQQEQQTGREFTCTPSRQLYGSGGAASSAALFPELAAILALAPLIRGAAHLLWAGVRAGVAYMDLVWAGGRAGGWRSPPAMRVPPVWRDDSPHESRARRGE